MTADTRTPPGTVEPPPAPAPEPDADAPSRGLQTSFWNGWNEKFRETARIDEATEYRVVAVLKTVAALGLRSADILEVGCGSGWMCARLAEYGRVTGVDLADEVIERSKRRYPNVRLVAGDVLVDDCVDGNYDVIVTMEVLSHVGDHARFVARLASFLKPRGHLLITSQNRFVWERRDDVSPQAPGQLRQWFSRAELCALLSTHFDIVSVTTLLPAGHGGVLRILNSPKLNGLLSVFVGAARLQRWKERFGLGQSVFVHARRREPR